MTKSLLGFLLFVIFAMAMRPSCYAQRFLSDEQGFPANAKEKVTLRNSCTKHFATPDGKAKAYISSKPIHYLDSRGRWQDIDCSLQSSSIKGYIAQNTSNSIASYFPADAREGVTIRSAGAQIKMGIDPMLKVVTSDGRVLMLQRAATDARVINSGNTITYVDLFPDASNSYQVDANQIKNNLILTSLPDGVLEEGAFLTFSEVMQLPAGWRLSGNVSDQNHEVLLKGALFILNERDQEVFSIPVPDVFELNNPSMGVHNDGNWEHTYKVRFLGQDKYEVSTMVPVEWLSDPSRIYPVVIDPTVTLAGNYGGWLNTGGNYQYGNSYSFVFAGFNTNGFTYNSYIRFDVSSIPVEASVTNTRLQLEMNGTGNASITETVFVNDVTGPLGPYNSYNSSVFDDLGDGAYASFACTDIGSYGFFDLGTDADNDVMNHLSTGNFQVGLSIASPTTWKRFFSDLSILEVTYNTDFTAPAPPAGLDLLATSDSGIDTDDITNDNTPTISGTTETNATVKLYDGPTEIGTTTADATTGEWQITATPLSDGAKNITAKAIDEAGNESDASSALAITIDTSAPASPATPDLMATSDSGIGTDNITNDNTPTISGTTEPNATVKLYDGAVEIGSITADATTGVWQIATSSMTDGTKNITAKAFDIAGNESVASSTLSITIDTNSPAQPTIPNLMATSDSGIDTDNITNDNTPTIDGTGELSATVKLYDGPTEIGSTTADATTGEWQITTSSLTDGTKNITAKAFDIAGNESVASSTLSITIDTNSPAPPATPNLLATSDSGIDTDNITYDKTPTISGTTEPNATVKLYDGAVEIGSITADATTGEWQITTSSLTDGTKNITAKAVDLAGNESAASSTLSITIDTNSAAQPTTPNLLATSDSGIGTDNITNDNTPTISGTTEPNATVKLYDGAVEIGSITADATTGEWQITTSSLTDGTKNITAKAFDIAGNESAASSTLSITIDTNSPAPPTTPNLLATSDSGIDTDNITNDNTPTIDGTGELSATVKLYDGPTEIGSTTADATTGEWQITTSSLTDGTKNITAKAFDIAGNESAASSTLSITIDTSAPAQPATPDMMATSDSGINTDNITNDNTPTISGTTEPNATVKLYDGPTEIGSATTDATTGEWQITTTPFTDGTKNITAITTDVAGNESGTSTVLTVIIDTNTPPSPSVPDLLAISDSGIDTDDITNVDTPAIIGTAEAGTIVKLYEGASEIGADVAEAATGAWRITTTPLTDGTKNITAKAFDVAGNESLSSQPLTLLLERVRPVLTITSASTERTNEPFTILVDISEDITGFDISDIAVTNGTASQLEVTGILQYSVLITPASEGTVTMSIPENAATDIAGNGNTSVSISREFDNRAPENYTIRFNSDLVDIDNVTNVSLIIAGAETGASYVYSITSENGGEPVTDSGIVTAAQFTIDGLNLEGLKNGLLTATIYLQDHLGNKGDDQTAQTMKTVLREIIIYTSFSPNGDGINDVWKTQSLMYYNNVEIEVFDRAGVRVFYTKDPSRGWDGRNHNGLVLTGGYLYIIRVKDNNTVKKGVLTLLK